MAILSDFIDVMVDGNVLNEKLETLHAKMLTLTPAMQEFEEIGLASITNNFEVGGRYSEAGSWCGGDNYGSCAPWSLSSELNERLVDSTIKPLEINPL